MVLVRFLDNFKFKVVNSCYSAGQRLKLPSREKGSFPLMSFSSLPFYLTSEDAAMGSLVWELSVHKQHLTPPNIYIYIIKNKSNQAYLYFFSTQEELVPL